MSDSVPRPEQWNEGARSSVEPFLHEYCGIRLDDAWKWLVEHGELRALPDAGYNPLTDATQHVVAHRANVCKACALWSVLVVLWTVSAELYSVEDLQAALRLGGKALRLLLEFRGCLEALSQTPTPGNPTPIASALSATMTDVARQLELFTDDTHARLSPDAREALIDSRHLVTKVCCLLRDAGFSYPEIALLIGDKAKGARDRIRMRCTRSR